MQTVIKATRPGEHRAPMDRSSKAATQGGPGRKLKKDGNSLTVEERQQLALGMMGWCWQEAIRWSQIEGLHNDKDDLFQTAFAGVLRAAQTFDPTRGNSFTTHAVHGCRGGIASYLDAVTPAGMKHLRRAKGGYLDKTRSLQEQTAAGGDLSEVVEVRDEWRQEHDSNEAFERLIESLPERHQEIIRLRFREGLKLRECGRRFGIGQERVRQILHAAFARIREDLKA